MTERIASFVADAAEEVLSQAATEIGTASAAALALEAASVLQTPAVLAARLTAAIADVPTSSHLEWLSLNALVLPSVPQTTAQRRIQAANQAALKRLVRDLAGLELAARLPARSFTSRADLRGAHRAADAILETVRTDADDAVHRSVATLRTALAQHVRQAAGDLPDVVAAAPAAVLPGLVVAYDIYEDVARAEEIAARNHLPRPGFVPARPIEVLE